ncbi:MAG: lasso peptide biosynthesis B2 protein [Hyphomonadaceae bacterium]
MRPLVKFFRLSPSDQRLYLRAFFTLVRVRATLTFLSFRKIAAAHPKKSRHSSRTPAQIASVVGRVARFVPGATCLTQAAAARYLLQIYGHPSTIRVGVKPAENKRFAAHAWLLHDDRVILGGDEKSLAAYKVLTDLDPLASS